MVRTVVTAFAFLTRIPLPDTGAHEHRLRAAALWFPLVGLTVGAAVGGSFVGLESVTAPLVAAAVAVAVGVAITGGFHEDGLADIADGFGGGWTVDRRLEIMGDPRLGTYGVLAIGCTLLIRVAAMAELSRYSALMAVATVATIHLLARNVALLVMGRARRARSEGLAVRSVPDDRRPLILAVIGWSVLALILVGPQRFALLAVAITLAAAATTVLAYRKIGGITGDVLGAIEQTAETAALVMAATSFYERAAGGL